MEELDKFAVRENDRQVRGGMVGIHACLVVLLLTLYVDWLFLWLAVGLAGFKILSLAGRETRSSILARCLSSLSVTSIPFAFCNILPDVIFIMHFLAEHWPDFFSEQCHML